MMMQGERQVPANKADLYIFLEKLTAISHYKEFHAMVHPDME